MLLFSNILLKHGRHFDYWNQPLNMHLLTRLLQSLTVLLRSVTHGRPVMFIATVLLPFVTYLLTEWYNSNLSAVGPISGYVWLCISLRVGLILWILLVWSNMFYNLHNLHPVVCYKCIK
jgi:hypothetical protein